MFKRNSYLLLFLLCFAQPATSQTPESILEEVRNNFSVEKIYVHYDKHNYIAGETIWFKAYLAEGILPSEKSTVLYVELVNDSGRVINKKILPLLQSAAAGNFELSKDRPQGIYTIRAYTRRMMNFGTENFYTRAISVYNPSEANAIEEAGKKTLIYFLPEGGNLVGNVMNTVAFKCTDERGYPVEVEGKITAADGTVSAAFKSTHNGMGKFDFKPLPGEKYVAECNFKNNQSKTISLPDVVFNGITFRIKRKAEKVIFEVNSSQIINDALMPALILGTQENNVVFKAPLPSSGKIVTGEIPVNSLSAGILKITVFNADNAPLAERLMFAGSNDYNLEGTFKADNTNLHPRGNNTWSFEASDTISSTFSVAVTDADKDLGDNKTVADIVSALLLTEDLKGYIYNPGYYFESADEVRQGNLDLVMLTAGWRRYSWSEMMTGRFPAMTLKDPNYITLAAAVSDPFTNKPLTNIQVNIFIKSKDEQIGFLLLPSDAAGNVNMPGMIFEDSAVFRFQNNNEKKSRLNVRTDAQPLSNLFYTIARVPKPQSLFSLSDIQKNTVRNSYPLNSYGVLLDEVKLMAIKKTESQKYAGKYISGRLGSTGRTLDFLADPPGILGTNILEYLKNKLAGVDITGGPFNYFLNMRHIQNFSGPIPMAVFVDEYQVEPDRASTLQVDQVALVQVISPGPLAGAGGALSIYTKKDGVGFSGVNSDGVIRKIAGFSVAKEFFSPDYSSSNGADILKDERSTVYWNPYLITDAENRKFSFSFYNTDNAKRLKIVLEGMASDGRLLHIEKIIE